NALNFLQMSSTSCHDKALTASFPSASLCSPPTHGTKPPFSVATIAILSVSHIRYVPPIFVTVFSSIASSRRPAAVIQEAIKGQNHFPGSSALSGLGFKSNWSSPENTRTFFLLFLPY